MTDAYNYIPSFFSDDPRGGALTYEQLQARRKIAAAIATRNRGFPKNIGEGLTYLGESIGDVIADRRAAEAEARYRRESGDRMRTLLDPAAPVAAAPAAAPAAPDDGPGPMGPGIDPFGGAVSQAGPETAVMALAQPEKGPVAEATATRLPLTTEQASQQPQMSIEEWKKRVARNESGGQRDPYSTIGERSRQGDYPYGKYQVMGSNVPKWTQAYLGRKMTPKEFLADPEAQEQVASARGGEYMTKYGPVGAAQAWFGGENWRKDPRATDTLGTHVAEYTRRFNIPLVEREQVVASAARSPGGTQLASLGGAPTPDTVPGQRPGQLPIRLGMTSDPLEETPEIRDAMAKTLAQQSPMQPQAAPAPPPIAQPQVAQQLPIGTPVPSTIRPPAGPPREPDPVPMSPRETAIRRALGATRDPAEAGQLQAVADQMAAQRKFENDRNIEKWKNELSTYTQRTDPVRQEQLLKSQQDRAAAERERIKTEQRGGLPQDFIIKGVETSAKAAAPLRAASIAINKVDDLLRDGLFTGTLSKVDLALAKTKAATGFGAPDPRIARTEEFTSAVAPIVAAAREALVGGAQISNADLQAAEKAAGGNTTLDADSLKGIMKSLRTIQMQTAMHHQKLLATASGGDPQTANILYSMHGLPMENIIPKDHKSVRELLLVADNEHERALFNEAWNTPGLAERIIARNRPSR